MTLLVMDLCFAVTRCVCVLILVCVCAPPQKKIKCIYILFPPLWPSVMSKVEAALSSLSGAVGGPVRLNGQSMKALLEFFDVKNAQLYCGTL